VKLTAIVPIFGPTYTCRKQQIEEILANSRNVRILLVADSFGSSEKESIEIFIRNLPGHEIELIEGVFGNPGSARNSALNKVETEWFCFWDSDDIPDAGKYLEMINSAEASNVPIAKGGYKIVSKSGEIIEKILIPTISPLHPAEHLSDPGLWRYVLNKKIYGELRFPPIRMGEDQDYLVQALMITDSVHIFPHAIYS
jgi:glycosyltransferase involved in cell wall biosynthesis